MSKTSKNKSSMNALVIAIVIVGVAILVIGGLWLWSLFQPGCHAYSKFSCSIIGYNYSTGSVTLLIGQNTGNTWYNVTGVFEPGAEGIQKVTLNDSKTANLSEITLQSGNTIDDTFNLGPSATGSIWEIYTNSTGAINYVRVAELILRK